MQEIVRRQRDRETGSCREQWGDRAREGGMAGRELMLGGEKERRGIN